MTNASSDILEILKSAYAIEVKGHTFYSTIAEKSDKPAVRELFEKLADDEVKHQEFLKNVLKNYETQGTAAFHLHHEKLPDSDAIARKLFSEKFAQQAKGAEFEFGAVSIGMTLETGAIAHFNNAARTATDADVKNFYKFLAEWEQGHFDALAQLEEVLREEFWANSGFSRG